MKTINFALFTLICLLAFTTCKKDKAPLPSFSVDCDQLFTALLEEKDSIVNIEINSLTTDLSPQSVSNDDLGHSANLEKLVERLEEACENFEVSIVCYACIETWPVQSEIKIIAESGGIEVNRIVDILTPENGPLQAVGVHQ